MAEKPSKERTEAHCRALSEAAAKQWKDLDIRERMIAGLRRGQRVRQARLKEAKQKEKGDG